MDIVLSLLPWYEVYLIIMDEHFDIFSDLFCEIFFEHYCIDINKVNWSKVVFVWFRYKCNCGFIERIW